MNTVTESKYKSQMKYISEKRERICINLPKGTKDIWKEYAAKRGMSFTEYITKLIAEDNK